MSESIYDRATPLGRAEIWKSRDNGEWHWDCCVGVTEYISYCSKDETHLSTWREAYDDLITHLEEKHR